MEQLDAVRNELPVLDEDDQLVGRVKDVQELAGSREAAQAQAASAQRLAVGTLLRAVHVCPQG
jgi:hypothetical protein